MITGPPKIDTRTFSRLAETLLSMVPHYTPEWKAGEGDAGTALSNIHAFITEMVITRLNKVPRKSLIAFLDMLGITLLPAQPSMVPITFRLTQGAERDVLVPAQTEATAARTDEHNEVPFQTGQPLLAVASRLREVISVDPSVDAIYVHSPNVLAADGSIRDQQSAFTLFGGTDRQEHSLYLAQKDLLNIKGAAKIVLKISLPPAAGNAQLDVLWEYWGEDKDRKVDRWIALELKDDGTDGFRQNGEIVLYKGLEGEIREAKLKDIFFATGRIGIKDPAIAGMKNRWIRCRLICRLTATICSKLPVIDTIFLKTAPAEPVPIISGFFNDVALDYTMTRIEAKVTDCAGPVLMSVISRAAGSATVYVDAVEGFQVGDEVSVIRGDAEATKATVQGIDTGAKQMTIFTKDSYTCTLGDTIRTTEQIAQVYAFGRQPKLYDAFYIGSKEAFSKKGAKIDLSFTLRIDDTSSGLMPPPEPVLAWEYWDGRGWQALTIIRDETGRLMKSGDDQVVRFICPEGIEETEVFGQKNYWMRTRIIGGDYGREQYALDSDTHLTSVSRKFRLPVIRKLAVNYDFEESVAPEVCLSFNNLAFKDMTIQTVTANLAFSPFVPLPDGERALYLGWDRQIQGGPVRVFFDAEELEYEEAAKPEIAWHFRNGKGWSALDFLDETEGFILLGHLDFIGPTAFEAFRIFDTDLYWLRGGLLKGAYQKTPHLRGVYPNTTWSVQAETIRGEILGSGAGEPDQAFSLFKAPVMEGQEIRVKEVISEEERQLLIQAYGQEVIVELPDATGEMTETWVRWKEVSDFFASPPKGRHYTLDRATGRIRFGNGLQGMVPPAGKDNIKAFTYRTGGGRQGNIRAREVKSLKSAVSGIDKVMNPIAADGGADTASVEEMLGVGPAAISHRYRAVTAEDYEWLARTASRKVVRARCLPNRNHEGRAETGWVTVIIVPESTEERPFPSLLLKREVEEYLSAHSLGAIASAGHLHVEGPTYAAMSVSVDLVVTMIDATSLAVREAKQRLSAFFHPLTGGPEAEGWDFGRGVAVSDVYALLEGIGGVDHIEHLVFAGSGEGDFIAVPPNALVASGEHTINARLKEGG